MKIIGGNVKMKFASREVCDLLVFVLNEKLIVKLDTLVDSKIVKSDEGYYVIVKDAFLNEDFLQFVGKSNYLQKTDMCSYLNDNEDIVITFGEYANKPCKILATTITRQQSNDKDRKFIFEIPDAEIIRNVDFDFKGYDITTFDAVFKVNPFNDKGDMFRLHIKK